MTTTTASIPRETAWRRFEQTLARRERGRLIRIGHIKMKSQPIVMEKNNEGKWRLPTLTANPKAS